MLLYFLSGLKSNVQRQRKIMRLGSCHHRWRGNHASRLLSTSVAKKLQSLGADFMDLDAYQAILIQDSSLAEAIVQRNDQTIPPAPNSLFQSGT